MKFLLALLLLAPVADAPKLDVNAKLEITIAARDLGFAQAQLTQAKAAYDDAQRIAQQRLSVMKAALKKYEIEGYKLDPDKLIYDKAGKK